MPPYFVMRIYLLIFSKQTTPEFGHVTGNSSKKKLTEEQ